MYLQMYDYLVYANMILQIKNVGTDPYGYYYILFI